jgi:DNA-binding IclR family transcriptional regulator
MPRGLRSNGPDGASPPSSVQKACLILRAMSDAKNARLTDIALAAGQDKATTLRLLDVLARHGFVNRDPESKRYSLGPEIFALGAAAMARSDPRAKVRPSLIQLVRTFEDTAILSVPRGAESVAVDVQQGSFAIRANYLEVGSRRPLGVGAGSLALLAWLPDDEVDALMPFIADRLANYPLLNPSVLRRAIDDARRRGYAMLLDVVVPRMGGIAVPILSEDGRPSAAISIAALSERISGREIAIAEALQREASACRAYLRQGGL